MRTALLALAAAGVLYAGPAFAQSAQDTAPVMETPAQYLITGGTIYTGRAEGETVETLVVEDGKIIFAGPVAEATDFARTRKRPTRRIYLAGGFAYPGFVDAHAHLRGIGERELTLNLDQVTSIDELVSTVATYIEDHPGTPVVMGRGWIETHWPEGRFPKASDLDTVSPDTPVMLVRADGHALVANTAALKAADLTAQTPVPEGGDILKDADGNPNGMLIDNAMNLLAPLQAGDGGEDMRSVLETAQEVYLSRGWTGLHNMSVNAAELDGLAGLSDDGALKLRVYNAVDPNLFDRAAAREPEGPRLTTRAVKIYMDGALGSRGALLSAPYADAPETSGLALRTREETLDLFGKALEADVQLAVHAIGDLGNARALDWMEESFAAADRSETGGKGPRWRIEHAQILRPADIARFAPLGVIASMQPSHAIGDLYFAPARLGLRRLDGAYAWASLLEAGAIIAGGSDAPVEVGSPLIEFYAASVRKDLKGESGNDWNREERVSRFEALQMFTSAAAYAAFAEDVAGTLEVGKRADLTVFDRDLMTVADDDILNAKTLMTIIDGDVEWSADITAGEMR